MRKCFILILGVFISFQAKAQFQPTIHSQNNARIGNALATTIKGRTFDGPYKFENGKVVDRRNQVVNAPAATSFVGLKEQSGFLSTAKEEKVRYELNQRVKYTCQRPWKLQKCGEGAIEAVRSIGTKKYVKVAGCDYLVESSLISYIQESLPQKQPTRSKAVAQQSSQ